MTGAWRRLGRLHLDTSAAAWAVSHAALPTIEPVAPGIWHLYLALRDDRDRARIGRARLTMDPAPALAPLDADPVLDLGALGAFDDSGVLPSCVVRDGAERLLYYTGWSRGVTVPFYLMAGLAVGGADGVFERASPAPLLDRSAVDPFLTASPFVAVEGERWRMWYVSGSRWTDSAAGPRHHYHIRHATSADGRRWERTGHVCLDYATADEHAFARPWVVRDADAYRMWFAVRGDRYRIGYAESADGLRWQRHDDRGGLTPAASGWDSGMVAYPAVFDHDGARYMLYNGNEYGRSGVGLAVWDVTPPAAPRPG
jgi:hypothetical protein